MVRTFPDLMQTPPGRSTRMISFSDGGRSTAGDTHTASAKSAASQSDGSSSSATNIRSPRSLFSIAQLRILSRPGDVAPRQKTVHGLCSMSREMVCTSPSFPSQTTTTRAGVLGRCLDNSGTASSAMTVQQQSNAINSPNHVFIFALLKKQPPRQIKVWMNCRLQCDVRSPAALTCLSQKSHSCLFERIDIQCFKNIRA